MTHWAQFVGPYTARLFERILADKPHPEMGYRSCLGLIRLAGQYSSSGDPSPGLFVSASRSPDRCCWLHVHYSRTSVVMKV